MTTTPLSRLFMIAIFALVIAGCFSTERVNRRSQLQNTERTGPVYVFTSDSSLYQLDTYQVNDSMLIGTGTRERDGTRDSFKGALQLSEVRVIETRSFSFGKTLMALGITAVFTGIAGGYLGGSDGLQESEQITYHGPSGGGGSSCPSLYSWNGSRYVLDGESFGTALGKMLEMQSVTVLPSLRDDGGEWKIRIMNERPETHFINDVELNAVEVNENAVVVADANGTLWPVVDPAAPVAARGNGSNDILRMVRQQDRAYWESDSLHLVDATDFEDRLEAEFTMPEGKTSGSLIISAINTDFSTPVYRNICRFLGDQAGSFTWSIEHDSELVHSIRSWIDQSSLKVSVWNGREWSNAGILLPEATAAQFSRLVRFSVGGAAGNVLKVRLSCLKDVWKFDALRVDWTSVQPLTPKPARLLSSVGPDGIDCTASLGRPDEQYTILLPPEKIELRYRAIAPSQGKKIVCALGVQGYLHEWVDRNDGQSSSSWSAMIPSSQRINVLKELLHHQSMFLPPIYADWIKTRK